MSPADTGAGLLAPDAWLTETLGIPTFSLRKPPESAVGLESTLRSLPGPVSFVFAKVPVADIARVSMLEACGFNVVDTQVTLDYREVPAKEMFDSEIRTAISADSDAVGDIAASCFRYSRFHQDPQISRKAADTVKRQWARNCVSGRRGKEVLIASMNGSPAGFLAVSVVGEGGNAAAVIDLIGVAIPMQGKGVGRALIQTFVSRWKPNVPILRVGTQVSNAPSLRLYQRCGFWFREALYVLHAHRRPKTAG